jgi:hypothetical protein
VDEEFCRELFNAATQSFDLHDWMNLNRIKGENCMRILRNMNMKQRVVTFLVALTTGIVVFGLPSESRAQNVNITDVTVTVGNSATFALWSPQSIAAGETLVLAQNASSASNPPNYNFDISDTTCPSGKPGASNCPAALIGFKANGTAMSFTDTNQALTVKNADPSCCGGGNFTFNEAQNYTQIGNFTMSGLTITVFVGYADNAHNNACGSDVSALVPPLPGSNICFPQPFANATHFQGNAQLLPQPWTGVPHSPCTNPTNPAGGTNTASCWDSGVIMFSAAAAPPPNLPGRMTGGGSIFTTAGEIPGAGIQVTHGFEIRCDATDHRQSLEVNIHDAANDNFHLDDLTAATCIDAANIQPQPPAAPFDTFIGVGKGSLNGVPGYTINFVFTDAGEPGTADTASYLIWLDTNNNGIVDGTEVPVLKTGAHLLQFGNHQAHKN